MNEKEKERNPNRKREKETVISSMIGFDTATSSFPTLLIYKSYRKKWKAKFNFAIKKFKKPFFVSKGLSINPPPRLEKFCLPVMVVKLRKGQNIEKFWKLQILTKSC